MVSVRRTDIPSWKIGICSVNTLSLLENSRKGAPGRKEQIFSKILSVAASEYYQKVRCHANDINSILHVSSPPLFSFHSNAIKKAMI